MSWHQVLLAAILAGGVEALASFQAACAVWGFPDAPRVIEITVPRNRRFRSAEFAVHHIDIPQPDRTVRHSIPVTTPARTLIDVVATRPRSVVEPSLDYALRTGLTTIPRLRWRIDEVRRSGRLGIAVLERMLDVREGKAFLESPLESKALAIFDDAALPEPVAQFEVFDGSRFVGRVDFAYPGAKIAIEADGYASHSGRLKWEEDLARNNALQSLGWIVLRFTWTDVTERPDFVVAMVRDAVLTRQNDRR
jgi:uncharacterized protein DUF559